MVFTGPVLYLAFTSNEIVKIFLDNLIVLVYLNNNPEIYSDYFFAVARKDDKIYNRGTCFRTFQNWAICQNMPKLLKSTELVKNVKIKQNTSEGKTKGILYTNQHCGQILRYTTLG